MDVVIKRMAPADLAMIGQVDRSETVEAEYIAAPSTDGMGLRLVRVEKKPPMKIGPWPESGVEARIEEWKPKIENGGLLLGAFRRDSLVGFAALGPKLDDNSADLVALFVDAKHRRCGVGSMLMKEVEQRATDAMVEVLFIASNRTASAVEFYLKHGCKAIALSNNIIVKHRPGDPVFAKELLR